MQNAIRLAVVLAALSLAPAAAFAQASIAGVVKDASGAVLPGVSVEASSPVLIEKIRQMFVLPSPANPNGSWLTPTSVLQPRFVKISAQIDF